MRKEATIQEWERLYELGTLFMEKKPWEYLYNEEYIRIRFSEDDEAFFTIMGNGGMEYGFGMYIGEIAFREMMLHLNARNEAEGDEYSMFLQNCLVMFADRKKDVPDEQMEVINKLKLNFGRGRKWIYFGNHARGYLPYITDQEDVRILIRYMEQLLPCLDQIEKSRPHGLHLMDSGFVYEKKNETWTLKMVVWNLKEMRRLPLLETTGLVRSMSSSWKQRKDVWEVDLALLHSRIDDEKYDRPLYPYMLLIVDHITGAIIYQELLDPECGPVKLCITLTELMQKNGKPKEILVSGNIMKEIFTVLEQDTAVPVKITDLKKLNEFKEALLRDMAVSAPGGMEAGSFFRNIGLKEEEINQLMALAGVNSEQELMDSFMDKFQKMMGSDGGMFFGKEDYEYDEDEYDEDEFDEVDEVIWERTSTLQQKTERTRKFFEHTFPYEEIEEDDAYDWEDEARCSGLIDAEWSDDWASMIGLCKRDRLLSIAEKLGITCGQKKKAVLAEEVHRIISEKPGRLKEILTDHERAALKKFRTMANNSEGSFSDSFPYSAETIISLLENGVIDICTGHSSYGLYLSVRLPRRLKGVRL